MINNYLDIFNNIVKDEYHKNNEIDSQFKIKLLFDKSVNIFYKKIRDKSFPIKSSTENSSVVVDPMNVDNPSIEVYETFQSVTIKSVSKKRRMN